MRQVLHTELTDAAWRARDRMGVAVDRALERTVRLGVTGLRRAGKTVFVTSLIDNLLKGGRLPLFDVVSANRFLAARLRPSPSRGASRFAYEDHLAAMSEAAPRWPEPTHGVSQLRVSIRYHPGGTLRRACRPIATLNLDLVDYPGEWLLDLPMLDQNYAEWSKLTLDMAQRPPRGALAKEWLDWLVPLGWRANAEVVRTGARLYTEYLLACRRSDAGMALIQPGRFVEPGELAETPLLEFMPLPESLSSRRPHSLWRLMEQRFEIYKDKVVRRFFSDHFALLDRQVVLVDLLGALNAGPAAVEELRTALAASLEAFRHGRKGWLDQLTGGRINRVLFAATKADHIASNQHNALRELLDQLVSEVKREIRFEGAEVETLAIAAIKCTETVVREHQGRRLFCVQGVPVGREKLTVLFPGGIPEGPEFFPVGVARPFQFLDFGPPPGAGRDGGGLPNIRLDQALNFLLGDYLV
ncbi:YcjX family protein [uncultured Gammaproteobacteria bacterium]